MSFIPQFIRRLFRREAASTASVAPVPTEVQRGRVIAPPSKQKTRLMRAQALRGRTGISGRTRRGGRYRLGNIERFTEKALTKRKHAKRAARIRQAHARAVNR